MGVGKSFLVVFRNPETDLKESYPFLDQQLADFMCLFQSKTIYFNQFNEMRNFYGLYLTRLHEEMWLVSRCAQNTSCNLRLRGQHDINWHWPRQEIHSRKSRNCLILTFKISKCSRSDGLRLLRQCADQKRSTPCFDLRCCLLLRSSRGFCWQTVILKVCSFRLLSE